MKARYITTLKGMRGDAQVFELDPPMHDENDASVTHVVVSAVIASFSGPETYIFPAELTDDGEWQVAGWGELEGSYRGGLSHTQALENAGYEVE